MKNFVRGAGVHLALTFYDANGNVVSPTGANVTLSYIPKGGSGDRAPVTFPLVAPVGGATAWTLDWDSSVAEPTIVFGNAVTTTVGVPVSAVDFSFRLIANRANQELAGDDLGSDGYQ